MIAQHSDAMCLNDEDNWSQRKGKPVPAFQLRSMAQTRACVKALRSVLGFVPVMAGPQRSISAAETMWSDAVKVKRKMRKLAF